MGSGSAAEAATTSAGTCSAPAGFCRWLQLLARDEDFQRPAIGVTRRASVVIAGANLELPGGRTRLLVNFVSRKTGYPRLKQNSLTQLQVRF